ncbi:hypothetical protein [Mangrovimonas sp. ST2L15]|uniref:hypothetical protein n=1 Tax=Mangrovimonas sp. ST2L15 TaxID=1645916 RepID=UPI0006B65A59|nr:hypothetical protein [Mangrovimonas sp. ST2L15]
MISINVAQNQKLPPLNIRENCVEGLKIWLVIKPLQFLFKNEMEKHMVELQSCKEGTVGYDIYGMLKKYHLNVIPKFENHDLKHLILGYGMSPLEEIRMQMYLLGNGNYSIYCLLFALSGILFPKQWRSFYLAFKKGKNRVSILNLTISDCIHMQTEKLKRTYNKD